MKTCLVVDDSSVVRKIARRILEGLEFEVTEAEDGSKALEICQRQLPDAVLLDWNMPVMDGLEFLEHASRTGQLTMVSVVIVSASSTLSRGHAIADGLPMIRKPALPDRLLELVRMHVGPPPDDR